MEEGIKVVTHAVSKKGIVYHTIKLSNVVARQVWKDQRETGEVHLASDSVDDNTIIKLLKDVIGPESIKYVDLGLIDPEGIFSLDYNVYMHTEKPIIVMSVEQIVEDLNDKIKEYI